MGPLILLAAAVHTVTLPGGGIAPDAAVDSKGGVHVAFARGSDAYYVRSADNGRTFSDPIRINSTDGNVGAGRERGPKIALGKGDSVHAAWIGPRGKGSWYTRLEGGRFLPERNVNDANSACDGTTIAADSKGRIFVFWIDNRLPADPKSPVAHPIFYVRSDDNGGTFSDSMQVKSEYPGNACACCNLEAGSDSSGVVRLVFRGGYDALRDMQLVESRDGRHFTWREVHNDGWKLMGCPMSGADLKMGIGKGGSPAVAWMSDHEIYYRLGDGPRQKPQAARIANRNYPLLLGNKAGDRLLAWTEGGELRWELTGPDGKVRSGVEKHLTPNSRPGGFTGADGNFYLIP